MLLLIASSALAYTHTGVHTGLISDDVSLDGLCGRVASAARHQDWSNASAASRIAIKAPCRLADIRQVCEEVSGDPPCDLHEASEIWPAPNRHHLTFIPPTRPSVTLFISSQLHVKHRQRQP